MNYRRNDSEGEAGRLFDDLVSNFSQAQIFMDVAGIEPGKDFRRAIDQSVASCSVLLALIGPHWIDSQDAAGRRRLEDPADFVRIELASALQRDVMVVPVLVRGAKMPAAEELPGDLKDLAYRNAVELTHARWKSDIQVLVKALRPYIDESVALNTEINGSAAKQPLEAGSKPTASRPIETEGTIALIDQQTTERLTRELAAFIGPIARHVVRRAAKGCTTVNELCAAVATEIPSDADRARFLRNCRG